MIQTQTPPLIDDVRSILNSDEAQHQHPDGICISINPDTNRPMALDPEEADSGTRCVFVKDEADDEALAPAVAALTNLQTLTEDSEVESDLDDDSDDDEDDDEED